MLSFLVFGCGKPSSAERERAERLAADPFLTDGVEGVDLGEVFEEAGLVDGPNSRHTTARRSGPTELDRRAATRAALAAGIESGWQAYEILCHPNENFIVRMIKEIADLGPDGAAAFAVALIQATEGAEGSSLLVEVRVPSLADQQVTPEEPLHGESCLDDVPPVDGSGP